MNHLPPESDQAAWIKQALFELKDGQGNAADVQRLREILLQDSEARRIYLQDNQLDHMLSICPEAVQFPSAEVVNAPQASQVSPKWSPIQLLSSALVGAGIAAAIILMFSAETNLPSTPPLVSELTTLPPIASLLAEYKAQINGSAADNNTAFEKGELSLEEGIAEIVFRNGAQIVLDGHCGFEILDGQHVILNHGKMWAYCPPEAHGFRVTTPGGKDIVDLGTEFGVEVSPGGETKVDVFDGLVEVMVADSDVRQVTYGNALKWSIDSKPVSAQFSGYGQFTTSETLRQKRIDDYHQQMIKRDDLLLYYNFHDINDGSTPNLAKNAQRNTSATILNPIRVSGRTEYSHALLLENKANSINFNLLRPQKTTSFTTAIWVKVNRLDSSLSTLINSQGWSMGALHFQITRSGGLRHGIYGGRSFETPSNVVQLGQWHLLVVTRNLITQQAEFYCDGVRVSCRRISNEISNRQPLKAEFGESSIGRWSHPISPNTHRVLKGQVDEVMIFNHALNSEEITDLYTSGKP